MNEDASIVGEWPRLIGGVVQEIVAQEFWCDGTLEDEANILYLKISDKWHRLYFDYEIIFWKTGPNGINDYNADRGKEFGYPLRDLVRELDLFGQTLTKCEKLILPNGVAVNFEFSNGVNIVVSSINDQTKIKI